MELERLNKTQIILLALFVAFVSSIASSIVTVTLLDQAPPGVTTTISKVVERTVERVVQGSTTQKGETVKTVIVREEDVIADAIDKQSGALARIFLPVSAVSLGTATDATAAVVNAVSQEFVANGFTISDNGTIVTDSNVVSEESTYAVMLADNTTFNVKVAFQDEVNRIAFLKPVAPLEKHVIAAELGDSNSVRLGGMAIVISGREHTVVNVGVISGFQNVKKIVKDGDKETEVEYRAGIMLSVPTPAGSIVLSGNGVIIAMGVGPDSKTASVPANSIKELLASIPQPKDLTQ